jgi:predicted fused transcriptional regulator/phosphomethylpyrimidine kinase
MTDERNAVLEAIRIQLGRIGKSGFAALVPEVGSNLAYALKGAKSTGEVAAVPGRIRNAMGRPVFLPPEFGASSHVASVILSAMKHDPGKRSAMNIRYSEHIVSALESMGLDVVFVDRTAEPGAVAEDEGASIPWVLRKAFIKTGKVPDAVYHKGAVGKEAMTHLIGRNPEEVAGRALQMLDVLSDAASG